VKSVLTAIPRAILNRIMRLRGGSPLEKEITVNSFRTVLKPKRSYNPVTLLSTGITGIGVILSRRIRTVF